MDEQDYIPLSQLSHAGYCLRRAALIANEQLWRESSDTAKGRREHARVHTERIERRGNEIKLYEYSVFSDEFGISGKCDCVEATYDESGCTIPVADFPVKLYPIEYKHGSVRKEEEYEIQLCAQAMCLEEMFATKIDKGAIFYISSHKRFEVELSDTLRHRVKDIIDQINAFKKDFSVPLAEYGAKCVKCSLAELCMPKTKPSANKYCTELKQAAKEEWET